MKELTQAPESLFWYWIAERHAIYLRRKGGQPKPWTTDPILRDYKFTNPFRENDRGTVWLRENFLEPHRDPLHDHNCGNMLPDGRRWNFPEDANIPDDYCDCGAYTHHLSLLAFNIAWYRMFNWWGTGKLLGWRESWPVEVIKEILNIELRNGRQVFTGAHIVYSTPGLSKIDCIVGVCAELFHMCVAAGALVTCAREERSLEAVFNALTTVHCVGGFMAYEMVTDMRHTRLLEDATDIMTWANPGPGARRGLQRLGRPYKGDAAIESMRILLGKSSELLAQALIVEGTREVRLPWDYPTLEMRDIEHSLCEFDKYCRVKFGEGEPRSKYPGGA